MRMYPYTDHGPKVRSIALNHIRAYGDDELQLAEATAMLAEDGYMVVAAVPTMQAFFGNGPERYETTRVILIAQRR